jgi:hypothetical protein
VTEEKRLSLQEGLRRSGLTLDELWLRHVSLGGIAGKIELEGYLQQALKPDRLEYDIIAQTLNEALADQGEDHPVGYAEHAHGAVLDTDD